MERNLAATNATRVRIRVAIDKRLRALVLRVKKGEEVSGFFSRQCFSPIFSFLLLQVAQSTEVKGFHAPLYLEPLKSVSIKRCGLESWVAGAEGRHRLCPQKTPDAFLS